jgi:hypothetical protein
MAGNFVIREALAIMTDKASSVMFMPGFRTTEALHQFSPMLIRDAEDCHLAGRRNGQK